MEFLIFPKIDKLLDVFFSTLFLKKNKNGTNFIEYKEFDDFKNFSDKPDDFMKKIKEQLF